MPTIKEIAQETIMRRIRRRRKLKIVASISLLLALVGCGGEYAPQPPPTQPTPSAAVTGQYDLVLTSSNGRGTTNIYTNFTQSEATFTGAASTLVCPSNDLSQCEGDAATGASIIPSGTLKGANVTIVISFPSTAGADTVTMVGTATISNLAGTYTDNLGDAGVWTASTGVPLSGTYTGTFNSTLNPLPITPTILISLSQDSNLNLTGMATITSSPCISSLTFAGRAIGNAFTLTDAASKASIIALPTGNNYKFSYIFDPTATHCAGDSGRGMVTNQSPWDY
jgi:hypothetical protein